MVNEFAALCEVAGQMGFKHSDLVTKVREAITSEYFKNFPEGPKSVDISVDALTGEARVYKGKEDITPEGFSKRGAEIARQTVIDQMQQQKAALPTTRIAFSWVALGSGFLNFLAGLFFFVYNGIYLFLSLLFVLNFIFNNNFRTNFWETLKSGGFYKTTLTIMVSLIPLLGVALFGYVRRQKVKTSVGKIFLLFELPLLVLGMMFLNMFVDPTPPVWFFALMIIFSVPVLFISLAQISLKSVISRVIRFVLTEAVAMSSFYLTVLFSFFVPLILGGTLKLIWDAIFSYNRYPVYDYTRYSYQLTDIFGLLMTAGFLMIVLALVLSATVIPYGLSFFFGKYWLGYFREIKEQLGKKTATMIAATVAIVTVGVFIVLSIQPSADKYVKKLQDFSATQSFDVREIIARELMGEETTIKRTVGDMANVRGRYLMTKDDDSLSSSYGSIFSLDPNMAKAIQESFKIVGYPFVYQGNLNNQSEISRAFESLFGYWPEGGQPTPVSPETKMVSLKSRSISARTSLSGLMATISVEEEYSSQSYRNEEVVYEFSFPAETVITELSLGPHLEYDGVIAPRGAAQAVYQQELRKGRDPAILEQIGVSKYRLRIFPIPPKSSTSISGETNQRVRFIYETPLTANGYALPTYTKVTNLSDTSARITATLNNKEVSPYANALSDQDSKALIAKACDGKLSPETVDLLAGTATIKPYSQGLRLPGCNGYSAAANLSSVQGLKIGILYDASYANKGDRRLEEVRAALQSTNFLQANNVDLFYFNDFVSSPRQVTVSSLQNHFDVVYFGKSKPKESLKALGGNYDAVLIIPGPERPEGFESVEQTMVVKKPYPIYVLLTDKSPTFSAAQTTSISQNGGTTVSSFNEVVNAVLARRSLNTDERPLSSAPFWTLSIKPKDWVPGQAGKWPMAGGGSNPEAAFVASGIIKLEFLAYAGDPANDLNFLDAANLYAQNGHVVSPYSSLIALVNEQQRQELLNEITNRNRYAENYIPPTPPAVFNPQFIELSAPDRFTNLGALGDTKALSVPSMTSRGYDGGGGVWRTGASSFSVFGGLPISLVVAINGVLLIGGTVVYTFIRLRRNLRR